MKRDAKPTLPKNCPLTLRDDGRLCKKIKGTIRYFGRWPDLQAALDEYLKQRDALHAGHTPTPVGGFTLKEAIEHFLTFKQGRVDSGKLSPRSLSDYKRTCELLTIAVKPSTPLAALGSQDFQRMASEIEKGTPKKAPKSPTTNASIIKRRAKGVLPKLQTGKRQAANPTTQKNHLNRATVLFNYIVENELTDKALKYQHALAAPDRLQIDRLGVSRGARDFTAEEIQAMVGAAEPVLKAMILLGLSCAFSNADCGTLKIGELAEGWHNKPRFKTGTERYAPLWPEVIEAIQKAMRVRPESKSDLVFLRPDGSAWVDQDEAFNHVSAAFRELLVSLKLYKKGSTGFYNLRRTFATVAANAGNQPAVNHIMGHRDATMPALYRQRVYQDKLVDVSQYVRRWYRGEIKLQRQDKDGFAAVEWS